MNDKVSLLERLRIDRGEEDRTSRGDMPFLATPQGRTLLIGGGGLLVLALLALAFWLGQQQLAKKTTVAAAVAAVAAAKPEPAPAAAPAVPGTSVLDSSGYIIAQRQATVSAKTPGRVREVLIEAGQYVHANQVVARLDDSNSLASLEAAKAGLRQATAALEAARVALADARPIFTRMEQQRSAAVISAQDFDTAKGTYDAAQTTFANQQAAVEVARANLLVAQRAEDDTIVRAPFSGVVTDKAAQPGEIVSPMASSGFTRTGICTIVDMSSLEADVDVSESFLNRVHPGQRAAVRLNAYPDWTIPGNVLAIIPTADQSKATVKVRIGFKTQDPRILPNMGVRVAFLADDEHAQHGQ